MLHPNFLVEIVAEAMDVFWFILSIHLASLLETVVSNLMSRKCLCGAIVPRHIILLVMYSMIHLGYGMGSLMPELCAIIMFYLFLLFPATIYVLTA